MLKCLSDKRAGSAPRAASCDAGLRKDPVVEPREVRTSGIICDLKSFTLKDSPSTFRYIIVSAGLKGGHWPLFLLQTGGFWHLLSCWTSSFSSASKSLVEFAGHLEEVFFLNQGTMKDVDNEVKEVREALDEVTLASFDDLENLYSTRERLHDLIQQGWLSLSKARYSMGSRAVSTLQYPHLIAPQAHVHTSETDGDGLQFLTELTKAQATAPSENQQQRAEEIGAAENPELRRRKAPPSDAAKEGPAIHETRPGEDKHPNENKHAGSESCDALRWFGILVPQSLRQAQESFREAVLLAGEVATLQARVEERRTRHGALLQKKKAALLANDGETRGEDGGELRAEQ